MRVRHTYVARGPWGGGAAAPGVRGQQNNGCEERTGSSAWNACHLAHLPARKPRHEDASVARNAARSAPPRERRGNRRALELGSLAASELFCRFTGYTNRDQSARRPQARTPLRDRSRARG